MPATYQWTPEQLQDILSSYSNGESAVSIAHRYGVSYPIIRPLLQKHGIAPRSRSEVRHVYTCNHTYFHTIDSEEKAYWLGFLTADGCITTYNRVKINLGITDVSHLYKLKNALEATYKVSTNDHSCTFVVSSPEIAADLAKYGILPKKTFSTKPAQFIPELARHYWRGIIDGDGHISEKPIHLTLVGDYDIVLGFQAFVFSQCPYVKANIYRKENIYGLTIRQQATSCLLKVLYEDARVYLDRKYERAQHILRVTPSL